MADGGLVVTHEDITERERLNARLEEQHDLLKAQEEKLRTQNLQLDTALNNMVQGLVMFDADQRAGRSSTGAMPSCTACRRGPGEAGHDAG